MGKKTCLSFVFILSMFLGFNYNLGYAAELEVGDSKPYKTITDALNQANNGDIIQVYPGVYQEKLEINQSITLQSVEQHEAVIEGNYNKHVITVKSPEVVIEGFTITASGHNFLDNDAGILIDQVDNVEVIDNIFEDILFGIYIDSSNGHHIKDNKIYGLKEKKLSERGNGIHYFNTKDNVIEGNIIKDVRDGMYFDHADKTMVTNNQVTNVRYGLHYMWSNDNTFRNNYFSNNVSGAAIMFSKRIHLEQNIFEDNRGYRAFGMFFQTAEDSLVENNLFFNNSIGIYSDLSRGNSIRNNTIIQNDIGMEMLGSNWDGKIYENSFVDNLQQVALNEINSRDQWYQDGKGNYWSDYSGIDMEKDGVGDKQHHSGSSYEFFMYQYPHIRLFVESPTTKLLQTVDKMFPILERAEVIDPYPLMNDMNSDKYLQNLISDSSKQAGIVTFISSLILVLLSVGVILRISKRFSHG